MDTRKKQFIKRRELRGYLSYLVFSFFICAVALIVYNFKQSHVYNDTVSLAYNKYERPSVAVESPKPDPHFSADSKNARMSACPIDFKTLYEKNPDVYAWIKVKGTKIDYPIMFSDSDDIDYYLTHNIKGELDKHGSVYIRGNAHNDLSLGFTIIYGHNMLDGSMFRGLRDIDKNSTNKIVIYTEDAKRVYRIIAVESSDDNLKTVQDVKRVAGKSYKPDGAYIALSTCTGIGNIRKVVFAECVKVTDYSI